MLFKTIDLFLQLVLIIAVALGFFIPEAAPVGGTALIAFAGIQILSLVVHAGMGKKLWKESGLRKIHIICTGIVILVMIWGLSKPTEDKYDMSGLGVVIYALIPGIAAALFYTVITFLEWKKIKRIS